MKSSWRKVCFIQLFKFCIFMSANCCYHCLTNVCVIQSISLIECNSLYHTKTRIHKRVKSLACTKCHKTFTSLSVIANIRIHTGPELQPSLCIIQMDHFYLTLPKIEIISIRKKFLKALLKSLWKLRKTM